MFIGGNVTVMVSDFDRAVRFYTETVGLNLKARYGNNWADISAPDLTIGLHPVGDHGPRPDGGSSMSIGLQVDDIDAAMDALKSRGVQFSRVSDEGYLRLANFSDPDNNQLYLAQEKH